MASRNLHSLPLAEQELLLNSPLIPAPLGIVSNLIDPPNQNTLSRVLVSVALVVATLVVALRTYARLVVLRRVHIEDYLALAGYILFIAFVWCLYTLTASYGILVHDWDIPLRNLAGILYIIHVGATIYCGAILSLKAACLLEWARIFAPPGVNRNFKLISYFVLWLNVLFYSAVVLVSIFSCKPIEAKWDRTIPGVCVNVLDIDVITGIFNIISDIAIFVLPQRVIWRLQMTRSRKLGVSLLFAIGALALTSAISRIVMTVRYVAASDVVYAIDVVALWCLAELVSIILVFCLPSVPKAFQETKHVRQFLSFLRSWSRLDRTPVYGVGSSGTPSSEPQTTTTWDTQLDFRRRSTVLRHLRSPDIQVTSSREHLQASQTPISSSGDIR